MQKRGRPSTKTPKLKDGFYIELKTKGASPIKIIRRNMEEANQAISQYSKNKIVKYLGEVKDGRWVDGDNKGKKI